MEKTDIIRTVDLSPFFTHGDQEEAKRAATDAIRQSCIEFGFFQVTNHGIPLDLMNRAMDLSRAFFSLAEYEKAKIRPKKDAPVPAGYLKQPPHSADKNESLMMMPPGNPFNVLPFNPPGFREAMEDMFRHFTRIGALIENIVNNSLGLPPNFLNEYNQERSLDLMSCKLYFPATETENAGISRHEDGNVVSFVFQDEVGGLEVLKDGQRIPVVLLPGTLSVNIGDTIEATLYTLTLLLPPSQEL